MAEDFFFKFEGDFVQAHCGECWEAEPTEAQLEKETALQEFTLPSKGMPRIRALA